MDSVTHFEIPYEDRSRAQKFYRDVFGWQFAALPDMDYHMVTTAESDPKTMMPKAPGTINGGMMARHMPGELPVIVISVRSLDEHLRKVEESGGKIVLPGKQVGEYGFYARVSDTEGNVVGVWQTAW